MYIKRYNMYGMTGPRRLRQRQKSFDAEDILYHTIISYHIISYHIIYYTILYYTIRYDTILYYTILYCTILLYKPIL